MKINKNKKKWLLAWLERIIGAICFSFGLLLMAMNNYLFLTTCDNMNVFTLAFAVILGVGMGYVPCKAGLKLMF